MIEHARQAVDGLRVAGQGLDLEYVLAHGDARRLGGAQTKVAVALPRQGTDRDRQAVEVARDTLGFRQTK